MPDPDGAHSRVFVLRLWREPAGTDMSAWRASLLNPVTRQRTFFSDPGRLTAFLAELDLNWLELPPDFTEPPE